MEIPSSVHSNSLLKRYIVWSVDGFLSVDTEDYATLSE